ncbi:PH domain-containing protein [Salipaludibacillus agaradhaerens]|uniref:PH domain-containing protein n=1 Tax=Salipaludibacillus agaradhaerens TaxID=76935 RepID=UPI002151156D|nr:PH domain-containing protein [Salipaludibacillus agaradhaerens]MCR6106637.1 PH domain-containing protein [Salipaludibacillus agaradhaerens]MCR6118670.1 PH domain-containing protein [Salipaludibacillus agaradhaerens]
MNSWKRQHPAAIFISFLSSLKEIVVSLIAVLIFGQTQAYTSLFYLIFFSAILFIALYSGFVSWWKFYYNLQEEELLIKKGLIFRKNRFIRKERIQSIDINANIIQRLFRLVELRIETAGGGSEPEFSLVALKREEAQRIKKQLLKKKTTPISHTMEYEQHIATFPHDEGENMLVPDEEHDSHNVTSQTIVSDDLFEEMEEIEEQVDFKWELGTRRLILAALTSSGVGIAATFLAAVVSQLPQLLPEWLLDHVIGWFVHSSILLIASLLLVILFTAWLFTLVGTMLKYGYFILKKQGNDIHISRGVLEQRQLTLNAARITGVRLVQSPMRQLFNVVSIYVESAGGGTKDEDLSTILVPLCKRNEVKYILEQTVPEFAIYPNYESLPKESLRRYMIRLAIPSLIVAAVATYYLPYGWLAFVLPIVGASIGFAQFKTAGICHNEYMLCLKTRTIAKTEVYLPKKRIQDMSSSQHPLQKLDNLHTLSVSVLTTVLGKTFTMRHVSHEQMEKSYEWYSYEETKRE